VNETTNQAGFQARVVIGAQTWDRHERFGGIGIEKLRAQGGAWVAQLGQGTQATSTGPAKDQEHTTFLQHFVRQIVFAV
jgi:hypothetical protein